MNNKKTYKTFTELEVWQNACALKNDLYKLVQSFDNTEKYRLADQIIRSSRSVTANIAEGYGRYTYKEQIRFCIQARGSLYETHNHLIDAYDCAYIDKNILAEYTERVKLIERLLNGYVVWLRKSHQPENHQVNFLTN